MRSEAPLQNFNGTSRQSAVYTIRTNVACNVVGGPMSSRWLPLLGGVVFVLSSGIAMAQTEDHNSSPDPEGFLNHSDCPYFGPQRERYVTDALRRSGAWRESHQLSHITESVTKTLGYVPGGSRTYNFDQQPAAGSIDSYIFADLQAHSIAPAP